MHNGKLFFLSVPDEGARRSLVSVIERYAEVRSEPDWHEARRLLRTPTRWAGIVLDLDGPEGLEEERLAHLRGSHPCVKTLVIRSSPSARLVNHCHVLNTELLGKPLVRQNLEAFTQRALVESFVPGQRLSSCIWHLARERKLTSREALLLCYAVGDVSREEIAERLDVSMNTLKTQVRGLLRKCGERSLDRLAVRVMRDALEPGANDLSGTHLGSGLPLDRSPQQPRPDVAQDTSAAQTGGSDIQPPPLAPEGA